MSTIISFVVGTFCGFVAGFLVFRNNQKKINETESAVTTVANTTVEAVKTIRKKKEK